MDRPAPIEQYAVPILDEHEVAFEEYAHEKWHEDERSWSPLITLEQLAKRPELEFKWYIPDWLPVGAKTIICAVPKCGKTILLLHMLKAIVEGGKFAGRECTPAKVLFLSEQTEHEFKDQVKKVPGLLGNPNFYLLLAEEEPPLIRTWEDKLKWTEEMLEVTKAKVLVVDTFGSHARLPADGENDSATIQNHINQMNFLFRNRYLSILMTHHTKKSNDDPRSHFDPLNLQSVRGSSAFVGGAGHIIMMDNPDKNTTRKFALYGRYRNGDTASLTLLNNEYHLAAYNRSES